MNWSGLLQNSGNTSSVLVTDPGSHWQNQNWHVYISGTLGAGVQIQIQYSPDTDKVTDANSRWFAPAALKFTTLADQWFQARFRKIRANITGGDGTTNLRVEIV